MKAKIVADRCPACGGENIRGAAKFCADCGKLLTEEYEPLDTIRSSYRLQRRRLEIVKVMETKTALFEGEMSGSAETAWACVVYSMVPYLGILFVPAAFAVTGFGYFTTQGGSVRSRRAVATCFWLSIIILLVQIGLWWLLYIIPKLTLGVPISN